MSPSVAWVTDETGIKRPAVHVAQMMPAAPGMYARVGPKEGITEYRLIVMWVLLDRGDGTQDIIGLTSKDISENDIMHQGYETYTTNVPVASKSVTIVR